MKTKPLTFLLSLTFLFLFSGSVFGGNWEDGVHAYLKQDYKTAHRLWLPLAEQGDAKAQYNLGLMYEDGLGVPQDYVSAHMWWNLSGSNGYKDAVTNRNIIEKTMPKQLIRKSRRMARNWNETNN